MTLDKLREITKDVIKEKVNDVTYWNTLVDALTELVTMHTTFVHAKEIDKVDRSPSNPVWKDIEGIDKLYRWAFSRMSLEEIFNQRKSESYEKHKDVDDWNIDDVYKTSNNISNRLEEIRSLVTNLRRYALTKSDTTDNIPRKNVTRTKYEKARSSVLKELDMNGGPLNESEKRAVDICTEMFIEHLLSGYNCVEPDNRDYQVDIIDMRYLFDWILGRIKYIPIDDEAEYHV